MRAHRVWVDGKSERNCVCLDVPKINAQEKRKAQKAKRNHFAYPGVALSVQMHPQVQFASCSDAGST